MSFYHCPPHLVLVNLTYSNLYLNGEWGGGAERIRPERPRVARAPRWIHAEHIDTSGDLVVRREQPEIASTPPKGSIGIIGGKLTRTIRSSIRGSVMVIEAMAY